MQAIPADTSLAEGARILGMWRDAGWAMSPLALCALVTAAIVVWKLTDLSVRSSRTLPLLDTFDALVARGMIAEATTEARESDSPAGRVLAAGLSRRAAGADRVARSIANAAAVERGVLERGLVPLAAIAAVAPMIGALGGVVVLLRLIDVADPLMAARRALVPAATGVVIAVLAAVLHNYLAARVSSLRDRITRSGQAAVDAIRAIQSPSGPT